MLKNTHINLQVIKKIATALDELNEKVIFVGGAVVSIYVNDPAADDVRPTKDVDISLQIHSLSELENLRQELNKKGFIQSAEDDVICRFRYDDIKVDVMSTTEVGWAPANKWFEPGFQHMELIEVNNKKINVLPLPYYLASKFEAFNNRGNKDPRTSHDFEDIVYILDNQMQLVDIIASSPNDVKCFLILMFKKIINDDSMQEAILANLHYETQTKRFELIMNKINTIIQSENTNS